jgi:hypothetical protein
VEPPSCTRLSAKKVAHHYGPSITIRTSILIFKPEEWWKVDYAKITMGAALFAPSELGEEFVRSDGGTTG